MPPQKPPKIVSLPRKTGWWILWPSKDPAAHQKANKTHSRPFLAGRYIEEAMGVSHMTAIRWCGDEVSTVTSVTVENPLEAPGADGKAYPSERLNAARRQLSRDELKDLVIRLRKEHHLSYRQIEDCTGIPYRTCAFWCEESISTVQSCTVENPPSVFSADGKERPAERLSPEDWFSTWCPKNTFLDFRGTMERWT